MMELDLVSYTLLTTIVGTITYRTMQRPKSADMHPLLLHSQSDVARLRHNGESAIYRSRMAPLGSPLSYTFDRTILTLPDFFGAVEKFGMEVFGYENGKEVTYECFSKRILSVYRGLRYFGDLVPQSENEASFVGIYGKQSLTTMLVSIACHCNGLVTIPISSKASSFHVVHSLQKSKLRILVIDTELLDKIIPFLKGTNVKCIVCIGPMSDQIKSSGFDIIPFDVLETRGHPYKPVHVSSNDIASIYFKHDSKLGVVLTQKNILSSIWSYSLALPPGKRFDVHDCLMVNLPLDNPLGYILSAVMIRAGGSILYSNDDTISNLLAITQQIKPTIFVSSPSYYRKIKQHVYYQYKNSFLFQHGYKTKKQDYINQGILINDCKYDLFLFKSIRNILFGGKLRILYIDNDDAIDPTLAEFFRIVISTQVLQTLSTIETASALTASVIYDYNADPSFKGAPLPCNEIKVVDVPEQGMRSSDLPNPRGELWVRGNNVFDGYYEEEEATDDALDMDGWFMTGMMCEILPNGTLKYLGKKS